MKKEDIILLKQFGWGGRIRTYGTQDQNLLPYHLATPQYFIIIYIKQLTGSRNILIYFKDFI